MLNYKLYQDNRKNNPNKGMWYARASVNETLDLDGLAKHMADHHSPYSQGLITGILKDMVSCIRELALDGKAVKIPDLAIFSLGLRTKPADAPDEFTASKNVESVKLRSRATGVFTRSQLKLAAQVKEQDSYTSPEAEGEGGEG
ncbi:MAG: DNA-binding protein [Prevotella sp.]|nr:DNA-binding protein [Prevotella sp.]